MKVSVSAAIFLAFVSFHQASGSMIRHENSKKEIMLPDGSLVNPMKTASAEYGGPCRDCAADPSGTCFMHRLPE
ncbi:uncharacterized protein MELLADRAFT_124504 [Melampsora larici-populina 98AG31]|uniref:Secreted protein n=1 Tax=Melampsora larici-populina (strain 98AG31 / pathotype 3-4-7) TaxID=747676 RepID=F4RLH5_MELLP|nr:uncharacterized protein MELLADRAFT_124504 [Melampsora larici-populina 98AG31]EGG06752.1 secreted protein [Melampsora larici-populina 98AG31]